MNFFEWLYERVLLLNLEDFEGFGINFPINIALLAVAVALCAASVVVNVYQGTVYTVFKKLLRAEAHAQDTARTLSGLGLSRDKIAKRLLLSGTGPLKRAVAVVGRESLSYEEYIETTKKKNKKAAERGADTRDMPEGDKPKDSELKFYLVPERREYAERIVERGAPSRMTVIISSALILGVAVVLALLMPTILGAISKTLV